MSPAPVRISHRRVLAIALPMMVAHATTPLLGLVGATAVGRLGAPHLLGAVALGSVAFDLLFWTFGALRMATVGLTAQAVGAGPGRDGGARETDLILARALVVALAVGLAIVALQIPIGRVAAAASGGSEAVTEAFKTYFGLRVWSAPFVLANYVFLGSVIGRARTGLGLMLQVAINLVNIILTVALVSFGGFGIAGAAIASLVAEACGVSLGFATLATIGARPFRASWPEILDRGALRRMLGVNGDILVRTLALVLVYALFARTGAAAGDVTLAANAILQNLGLTAGYVLDGFATAGETLCGQSVGARDEAGFRRAVRLALWWCGGFGAALSLVSYAGGTAFIDLVSTSPAVQEAARRDLPLAALMPLASAAAFTYDGVFIGATWTAAMRNLMLLSLAAFLLVLACLEGIGNTGLWVAMLVFLAARGALQAIAYPGLARRTFAGDALPA